MRTLTAAAILLALAVTPVTAQTAPPAQKAQKAQAAACTGENIAKLTSSMDNMPYTPLKTAMQRELGMVNTEMSKGNMRAACTHYARAQNMAGVAQSMGAMR